MYLKYQSRINELNLTIEKKNKFNKILLLKFLLLFVKKI